MLFSHLSIAVLCYASALAIPVDVARHSNQKRELQLNGIVTVRGVVSNTAPGRSSGKVQARNAIEARAEDAGDGGQGFESSWDNDPAIRMRREKWQRDRLEAIRKKLAGLRRRYGMADAAPLGAPKSSPEAGEKGKDTTAEKEGPSSDSDPATLMAGQLRPQSSASINLLKGDLPNPADWVPASVIGAGSVGLAAARNLVNTAPKMIPVVVGGGRDLF